MNSAVTLETVLRRDRFVIVAGLVGITALAWLYMIHEARAMVDTGVCHCMGMKMSGPDTKPWSGLELVPLFLMWVEMMVAMMIPSAAPMIATYARVARGRGPRPGYRVGLFAAGYVTIWTGFSAGATAAQVALQRIGMVSGALTATPVVGAVLLLAAGLYQATPLKDVCLSKCRSPLGFLLNEWREGAAGAYLMGLHHGAMCVGCCAMLMLLLFVFGVMNLVWVAALSVFVVLEKSLPGGRRIARVSGYAMLAGGVARLL